jgi:hypothetical protein
VTDSQSIALIDDEGRERRFTMHDAFDLEGVSYYLVESVDDPDEVLLLRESQDGLEAVDGAELNRVMSALEEDRVE